VPQTPQFVASVLRLMQVPPQSVSGRTHPEPPEPPPPPAPLDEELEPPPELLLEEEEDEDEEQQPPPPELLDELLVLLVELPPAPPELLDDELELDEELHFSHEPPPELLDDELGSGVPNRPAVSEPEQAMRVVRPRMRGTRIFMGAFFSTPGGIPVLCTHTTPPKSNVQPGMCKGTPKHSIEPQEQLKCWMVGTPFPSRLNQDRKTASSHRMCRIRLRGKRARPPWWMCCRRRSSFMIFVTPLVIRPSPS
jgi:hypothetical protein